MDPTHHTKGVTDRMQIGVSPAGHPNAPVKQQNHPKGPAHGTRD